MILIIKCFVEHILLKEGNIIFIFQNYLNNLEVVSIVGVIHFNAPFVFGMLTVLFIVIKIAASAKTVVKIIRSTLKE